MMNLLDQLNTPQKEAVMTTEGALLVISGAGSGKTRVVTYRIAHLLCSGVDPAKIVAVTFTNKAAREMQERIHQLTSHKVLICTFHSLGARILRESIHHLGYERNFIIYDEDDIDKLLRKCIEEVCGEGPKMEVKAARQWISAAKNKFILPEQADEADLDQTTPLMVQIYKKYQQTLKEYNALDFDDLLLLTLALFEQCPSVKEYYQQRWHYVLIDEYQDTNSVQYRLVKHLVSDHGNLCAVGDPDQSIYSWRGANIDNILRFESDFPGAKIIRLEQNYRSRSNILEAANALIRCNRNRYEKALWTDRGTGEPIVLNAALDDLEEARYVAKQILYRFDNGIPLRQMAVFYRTNAQSRQFEEAFLKHRIPFTIIGGISFYQRREIKDILAFLRIALTGNDFVAFERTLNIPKRGFGEATIEKIRTHAKMEGRTLIGYCTALVDDQSLQNPLKLTARQKEGLRDYIDCIHKLAALAHEELVVEVVEAAIKETAYLDFLMMEPDSFEDRKENLESLVNKAAEWSGQHVNGSIHSFLEELSLKSSLDEMQEDTDRVSLMTIHNGKGLEFTAVFLAGMEEMLFPHANAYKSESALEEERRLCYVGMTRAKEYLYLSYAKNRRLWGTLRTQQPSPFLDEIPKEFFKVQKRAIPSSARMEEPREPLFSDEMPPPPPERIQTPLKLEKGDTIVHRDFGIGMIIQISENASLGQMYKIFFPKENRERTVIAKMAPLKRI